METILREYASISEAFVEKHRVYLTILMPGSMKQYDEGFISLSALLVIGKDLDSLKGNHLRKLKDLYNTPIG